MDLVKVQLIKLLLRLYDIKESKESNKNKILFNGIDIKNYDIKELRNRILFVSHEPNIFNETVMYNIKYGNETLHEGKIIELCDVIYSREWLLQNRNKSSWI